MHIFHKWSKWETYGEGTTYGRHSGEEWHLTGSWASQKRTCTVCEKLEIRTVQTGL